MQLPSLWASLWLLVVSLTLGTLAEDENVKAIPLRTHSFSVPFLDSDMQSRWFDFGGDTIIRTDQYIRLTSDAPSRTGWVFSRVPLTATNWEIEIEFKISGSGNLYGDGFALWVTKERAQQGSVFGFKDKFEGLGIFFDTYKNNRPGTVFPYVMAMIGDGNTAYDKDNDGKANEVAGCSARGIRNQDHPTKARLTHFADKSLRLDLAYKAADADDWTNCFVIDNPKIPSVAYLGFTAETGELSDNHDIISVATKNLYQVDEKEMGDGKGKKSWKDPNKVTQKGSGGGWGWFFFKFLLFGVIVAGAYIGFTAYRTRQRSSRF
ncbi:hypothetical protein K402DRAFT_453232 [Aulographum hederae CBS 113979]|uniref:L-type lectin-like domain-containing protein n=1 Tax=Aulographum hederae CBS 113979 TaxID=1176131 RepID=A0A6G1H4W2_9PEZI|nr:hypothetical protein K402DRAFT_453232 [Aulographum hederae CBS 113979]